MKPICIVLYPFKVTEFISQLFEREYFRPYCDIEIWDISIISDDKFSKSNPNPTSPLRETVIFKSFKEVFTRLIELKKENVNRQICIINSASKIGTLAGVIINILVGLTVKRSGAHIIDYYAGGIQLRDRKSVV